MGVFMVKQAPARSVTAEAKKKPPRCGTGGAKSFGRLEPSRRVSNDGSDYGYDGDCDHGNVGAARGSRRTGKIHVREEESTPPSGVSRAALGAAARRAIETIF